MSLRFIVLTIAAASFVLVPPSSPPEARGQVRIDDPDDPFAQRPRDRRRFRKRIPRKSQRPWLGVGLANERIKDKVTGEVSTTNRVQIRQVFPGSGAKAAGLVAQDIVLEIDGVGITSVDQLIRMVASRRVGDRLVVAFERAGKRKALTVTLGTRPDKQQMVRNTWLGKQLPASFTFSEPLAGGQHALKEFRGKPLIIEFWATYCGPCKRAAPWLDALRARYAAKGLQVVKISNQDPETVRAHLRKVGHTAGDKPLVLVDPNDIVRRKLLLSAMPTFLYVDAAGVVRNIGFGARSKAELDRDLQLALNTPKPPPSQKVP